MSPTTWVRRLSVLLVGCLPLMVGDTVGGPGRSDDRFGVAMLFATAKGGREWHCDWSVAREVGQHRFDPRDPLFRNSDGVARIAGAVASVPAGRSRFFVMTPKERNGRPAAPLWKNVEMTVYVRCQAPTQSVPGQALSLSARSGERHSDSVPCEGTSYHASLRFDGQCGFKKEVWHTGRYSDLRPVPAVRPWRSIPQNEWIGIKFVCRNCDNDRHVRLQLYVDRQQRNDWQLLADFTDRGGWEGKEPGCNRPKDFILTDAYPAVYFRTDYVPVEVRNFSVREIDSLP